MVSRAPMHKPWVIGNWKLHGTRALAQSLPVAVATHMRDLSHPPQVVLAPPFPWIPLVSEMLATSPCVKLAAQDCSAHPEGAYTGEVSASMLSELGCDVVILGHSERRQYHAETDTLIHQKMRAAHNAGLLPVICVGESLAEREKGIHLSVVESQVKQAILGSGTPVKPYLIAYEPVWAIGTGKTPTPTDISAMHKHIASVLSYATSGNDFIPPILYGGSVKSSNARELFAIAEVSGVLVGGASLKSDEFNAIISAAAETRK